MKKISNTLFSLIAAVILQSSFAWAKQNSVSVFNQKIKSEVLVAHKVTEALAKDLDPKLFEVQVQTEISPVSLEVKKAHITLQLSQQLTQTYRAQLTKWLKHWVETTYGVRGDARVEWMPIEVTQSVSVFSFDLFLLISLLIAATGLLVRAIIKARPPVQLSFGFIEGKITNILEEVIEAQEEVFTVCVEQLALVAQPEPKLEVPQVIIEEEVVKSYEPLIIEPIVSGEPFIEALDEIVVVSPFAFIDHVDTEKLKSLFFFFDLPQQVAFFMKAPRTSVQRLTNLLDKKIIVQILAESAQLKEANDEDLVAAMQLWQETQQNAPAVVAVPEANEKYLRLKEIWLELSTQDKALLLEKLSKENQEIERFFLHGQEQVNSLKNWSPEKLRKFCLQVRTRDLAAAIKVLPFLSEVILLVCPESMKKAILFEAQALDEAKIEIHFDSFVATFERYITKANSPKPEANLLQIRTKLLQ